MKNKAAQELGKLGGTKTKERHGLKHFSDAGKKGMLKRWGNKKVISQAPTQ